jgi:hypothetical protein
MPKENDLEGLQDQGGKHGMPQPATEPKRAPPYHARAAIRGVQLEMTEK